MQKFTSWSELKGYLADQLLSDEETSFAFVPLFGDIQPTDLVSIRHANRICDVVLVAQLGDAVVAESYLKEAGATGFVTKLLVSDAVKVNVGEQDASLLMQLLLKIMPSAVVVSSDNYQLYELIKSVHSTYEDFFTLLEPNTPQSLYDSTQIEIQASVNLMQQRIFQGVTDLNSLTSGFLNDLKNANLTEVQSLKLKYLDDFSEVRGVLDRSAILHIQLINKGQTVGFAQKLTI